MSDAYAREASLVARVRRLRKAQADASSAAASESPTARSAAQLATSLGSDDPADALDEAERELERVREARFSMLLDAIKSLADVHVSSSMAALGPLRNEGRNRQVVAVFGFGSALISLYQLWSSHYKAKQKKQ